MRLKGLPMCKSVSEDLVAKERKQMRHMQGHFLVATLAPLPEGVAVQPQFEPPRSFEVANTRQALLQFCQLHSLQFNSLRYAQYSTMRLIYEMLHPTPKTAEGAGSYCVPNCCRGRTDDGSMMIGCDVCDNWFHPTCLVQVPESTDDPFVCPLCVESKAEMYLSNRLLGSAEADPFAELLQSDAHRL